MSLTTERTDVLNRGGLTAMLLLGLVFGVWGCGGSDSSEVTSSPPSEAARTPSASIVSGGGSTAPLGTGFIMMSRVGQLHLTEASYLEQSDCAARISALGDADEYAGCMEVPAAAICLQVSEGNRESDRWWECFEQQDVCEAAIAGHEVAMEVGGVRAILRRCAETELASVFASM